MLGISPFFVRLILHPRHQREDGNAFDHLVEAGGEVGHRLWVEPPPKRIDTASSRDGCVARVISQYAAMGIPVTAPGQRDDMTTARHPPDCLSCGRPMRFERTITQVHRSPELQTFECRPCGLVVTAESGSFMSSTQYLHS